MMTKGDFVAVMMVSVGFGGLMIFGSGGRYGTVTGTPPAEYLFGLGSGAAWIGLLLSLLFIFFGGLKLRKYVLS